MFLHLVPTIPSVIAADAPPPPTTDCNPEPEYQPMLQLSLDVLLVENYAATLRSHAHDGSWSDGGGKPAKVSIGPGGVIEGMLTQQPMVPGAIM